MLTTDYIPLMCRYNRWMNERLFTVCATMPDDLRREDKGAFFHSVHGTLNHLLLADRLWLGRFLGTPRQYASLDQELYADFMELWHERRLTDDEIDTWAQNLTEEKLHTPLEFTSLTFGTTNTLPYNLCVIHFFNHQTHHRGQLTTLMEQMGYDSGNTDLMWMPRA